MNVMEYDELMDHLEDDRYKYYGEISCITLHCAYLFVGNSKGFIRVFDLQSEAAPKDLKPLFGKETMNDKVMCIDVSLNMEYTVAGYESGQVALFDMKSYKLAKIMNEVHFKRVVDIKIIDIVEEKNPHVNTISVDLSGFVS